MARDIPLHARAVLRQPPAVRFLRATKGPPRAEALDGRHAAIHEQFRSIDVAGVVRGKEQRGRRDLLRLPHRPAWDQGFEEVQRLLAEDLFLHR